jgi:FtsH-binding integral membrane protein
VVRERIQATYGYFAGSLVITAASAYGIARSRFIHRWMAASPWLVRSTSEVLKN